MEGSSLGRVSERDVEVGGEVSPLTGLQPVEGDREVAALAALGRKTGDHDRPVGACLIADLSDDVAHGQSSLGSGPPPNRLDEQTGGVGGKREAPGVEVGRERRRRVEEQPRRALEIHRFLLG